MCIKELDCGTHVEGNESEEIHRWVSSLLRGWGWGRGKGARGASSSWGGGRVSFRPIITLCSFQPQEEIRPRIPSVRPLTASFPCVGQSRSRVFTLTAVFNEACEWYHSHWYPPTHRLSTNHYFHYSCRPSGNEKTGGRRQMFGEVIDLRWEDCDAVARDGRVIAMEELQSPLT